MLRRTQLARVSAKRRAQAKVHAVTREHVFARDGHACRIAPLVDTPCFGPLTPHHLKKASQGGEYTEANLWTACAHHNEWVEDHPTRARALGLVL